MPLLPVKMALTLRSRSRISTTTFSVCLFCQFCGERRRLKFCSFARSIWGLMKIEFEKRCGTINHPHPVEYAILLGASLDLKYKNVIVRPERCRVNDVLCQTIFFPNCFAHVKLDSRPPPPVVQLAMVQRRDTNYMFCFPYERSPYKRFFEGLMDVIRESRKTGLFR